MEQQIVIPRTARFYLQGELTEKTRQIWIVCHGYGHLGQYFIKKFAHLDELHFVIAPEALNRFYIDGFHGKVGASWMTKDFRTQEIQDYCTYLDHVYAAVMKDNKNTQINVLGFSQGAATASRWTARTTCRVDRLVLWSGALPEDLLEIELENIRQKELFVLRGLPELDKYLTEEAILKQDQYMKEQGLSPRLITFDGGHEIAQQALNQLVQEII